MIRSKVEFGIEIWFLTRNVMVWNLAKYEMVYGT